MKITNISPGPRGINTVDGQRIINVGETVEAELSEAELEGSKETGWFKIEAAGKRDPLDHDGDGKKGGSLPKSER